MSGSNGPAKGPGAGPKWPKFTTESAKAAHEKRRANKAAREAAKAEAAADSVAVALVEDRPKWLPPEDRSMNKAEIRAAFEDLSQEALMALRQAIRDPKTWAKDRAAIAQIVFDRAFGAVTQVIRRDDAELGVMTDEELKVLLLEAAKSEGMIVDVTLDGDIEGIAGSPGASVVPRVRESGNG